MYHCAFQARGRECRGARSATASSCVSARVKLLSAMWFISAMADISSACEATEGSGRVTPSSTETDRTEPTICWAISWKHSGSPARKSPSVSLKRSLQIRLPLAVSWKVDVQHQRLARPAAAPGDQVVGAKAFADRREVQRRRPEGAARQMRDHVDQLRARQDPDQLLRDRVAERAVGLGGGEFQEGQHRQFRAQPHGRRRVRGLRCGRGHRRQVGSRAHLAQPVLEPLLGDVDAFQELADPRASGQFERPLGQRQDIAFRAEHLAEALAQCAAQLKKVLAQVGPALMVVEIRPELRLQPAARARISRRGGEKREDRPLLGARQPQVAAVAPPDDERPVDLDTQTHATHG
jgi:hypothetical protein